MYGGLVAGWGCRRKGRRTDVLLSVGRRRTSRWAKLLQAGEAISHGTSARKDYAGEDAGGRAAEWRCRLTTDLYEVKPAGKAHDAPVQPGLDHRMTG